MKQKIWFQTDLKTMDENNNDIQTVFRECI